MPQAKLFSHGATILVLLLHHVTAQQNCINTCTDSAEVLTQLKTCSGCGTDDWACFCRCPQYIDALLSCAKQYCTGSDITDSIVSFCANQGVTLSSISAYYTSTSSASASSSTSSTTFDGTSSTASSTAVAASLSSFTATDTSDLSTYLSSAVPSSVQTESSAACFVNTQYSYYSTPTWYSTLPTQVQSYYSSVNQGNTAACTLSPAQAAAVASSSHHKSGLSAGAIAGIVIGAILAALLLAALLWCCLRRRKRSRRDAAVAESARSGRIEPRMVPSGQAGSQPSHWNEKKGFVGAATPSSNQAAPVLGGAALGGNNEKNPDWSHTTTTTTRTTIRPRPKNPATVSPAAQPVRPPPQPIQNHANSNDYGAQQTIPRKPVGRRVF